VVKVVKRRREKVTLRTKTQAQCSACKEIFSSTSNFDKHLKGTAEPECRDPENIGMVYGSTGWKTPTPPGKERWWEKVKESQED